MADPPSTNATCPAQEFSWGVRVGLVLVTQAAALSMIACVVLVVYIAYNGFVNKFRPPPIGQQRWFFMRTAVDHYLLCLFVGDIFLSFGALMHIRWISQAGLEDGVYCVAQGVIKQIGDVLVALSSLAIAVHTFLVLFFRWRAPQGHLMPLLVLAVIWIFIILITVLPPQVHKGSATAYFGKSVYWCSIEGNYLAERIGLLYAILWFTALANIILYVPLFLCMRGNIVVTKNFTDENNNQPRLKISWKSVDTQNAWSQGKSKRQEAAVVARQMLVYPIVYIILIVPRSVVRFIEFAQNDLPPGVPRTAANSKVPVEWTMFAHIVFASSGLVNVLLYALTRPSLFPSLKWLRKRAGGEEDAVRTPEEVETNFVGGNGVSTMNQHSSGTEHHPQQSFDRSPASYTKDVAGATAMPMLADDDDDDGHIPHISTMSSSGYGHTLPVPTDKSWTSRSSRSRV